ncbi:MAG: hypothetical protein U1F06_08670 [Steroidobacteraceae bacterium]
MRDDHAEPGHLRHREIDEHDAAGEHLQAERHVRDHDQNAGDHRRREDGERIVQRAHRTAPSSRVMVSSNRLNRSRAAPEPPTVYGSTTTGACTRSASQSAALASL